MATLRGVCCSVSEYAGDGQGEEDEPPMQLNMLLRMLTMKASISI